MLFLDAELVLFIHATYLPKLITLWYVVSALAFDVGQCGQFYSRAFPISLLVLCSPPYFTRPPTLPHVCHAVTFSQRAHSDLVHRQSCWCEVCVPLFLFSQIPLTTRLPNLKVTFRALECTPRPVIVLSWAKLGQQCVNKCPFMYLTCVRHINTMPFIQRCPQGPVCQCPL